MSLETGTFISDLVVTNPTSTDQVAQGDDHIRLIKSALLNTFPDITAAISVTQTQINTVAGATYPFLTASIADGAITTAKIVDANVTQVKLANASVGTAQLIDANVTTAKLVDANVTTAKIADGSVTYGKLQAPTAGKLLGAVSGAVGEITPGAGLLLSGTTLSAPAFPPVSAFKNLSIKVASNTTATCAADFVTVSDGTNFKTIAFPSSTLNLGSNGALNQLETGLTINSATWYSVWAIAKADGSLPGFMASTSATAPTLPSGYTLAARVGWLRTASGSAQLMGTFQFGRRAQYVTGLAQTTRLPVMVTGTATSFPTSLTISSFVPSTASEISFGVYSNTATTPMFAHPNSSADGSSSLPAMVSAWLPSASNGIMGPFNMLLESATAIFIGTRSTSDAWYACGWVDNI